MNGVNLADLQAAVKGFKAEIDRLARREADRLARREVEHVRQMRAHELEQRAAEVVLPVVVEASSTPDRPATVASDLGDASGPPASLSTAPASDHAKSSSRRRSWNRDTIIDELVQWIATGMAIDASFLKRHGPPGLVPATAKVFGRLDAGLNVASLQFEKRYPPGSPQRARLDLLRAHRSQRAVAV